MNQTDFWDPIPPRASPRRAKEIRAEAQRALKGNWVMGSVITFLYQLFTGLSVAVGMIPMYIFGFFIVLHSEELESAVSPGAILLLFFAAFLLCFLGLFLVGAPLTLGYFKMHLDLVDGKAPALKDLFHFFKIGYRKAVGAYALYYGVCCLSILPALGGAILAILLQGPPGEVQATVVPAVDVSAFIMLAGILGSAVLSVVLSLRYSMVFFLLTDEPTMTVLDAFRNSRALMKGNLWRLLCLSFSFLGWYLLLILAHFVTCGTGSMIGAFPLQLYAMTSTAVFYAEISHRPLPPSDEPWDATPSDFLPPSEENEPQYKGE